MEFSIKFDKLCQDGLLARRAKRGLARKLFVPNYYQSLRLVCAGKTGHATWWPCLLTDQNNLNILGRPATILGCLLMLGKLDGSGVSYEQIMLGIP